MKFFKLYSLALAGALMLGACSSSDDLKDGGATANEGKSYIAVNIKSVGTAGAGTRAGDYTQGGATYEDGTENEGAISKVRFFFFNSDGSPYIMKGTDKNYKELNSSVTGATESDRLYTIEGKTAAMMVIKGETKTAPAYMIAVVNPQTLEKLEDKAYRESQLRDQFTDTKFIKIETAATGKKYSDFVMSNSVYSENGARVCASSVSGHVEENQEEAEKNPVDIYVERVVAKATTTVNTANWEQIADGTDAGKYKIKVGEIYINAENKKDVYAVVQGWGLADENGQAELEKQIDVTNNNLTSAILGIDLGQHLIIIVASGLHLCLLLLVQTKL